MLKQRQHLTDDCGSSLPFGPVVSKVGGAHTAEALLPGNSAHVPYPDAAGRNPYAFPGASGEIQWLCFFSKSRSINMSNLQIGGLVEKENSTLWVDLQSSPTHTPSP